MMKKIWPALLLPSLIAATAGADEMSGGATGGGTTGYPGGEANGSTTFNSAAGQTGNSASTGYITPWAEMASGKPATACVDVRKVRAAPRTAPPSGCGSALGDAAQGWKLTPAGQIIGLDGKCLEAEAAPGPPATRSISTSATAARPSSGRGRPSTTRSAESKGACA